eukprot:1163908-Prymnesium_polylepis.1
MGAIGCESVATTERNIWSSICCGNVSWRDTARAAACLAAGRESCRKRIVMAGVASCTSRVSSSLPLPL